MHCQKAFNVIVEVMLEWRKCSVTERSIEKYMGCWEIRLDDAFSLGEFGSFFDLISEIVHCECSCRV